MEQLALFAISPLVVEDSDNELDSNHVVMPEDDLRQAERRSATPMAELDWHPDPPLHLAAFRGDVTEIKRLIVDGADIDATGETWGTTFAAAEMGGYSSISKLLRLYSQTDNSLSPEDRLPRAEMQLLTDALEECGGRHPRLCHSSWIIVYCTKTGHPVESPRKVASDEEGEQKSNKESDEEPESGRTIELERLRELEEMERLRKRFDTRSEESDANSDGGQTSSRLSQRGAYIEPLSGPDSTTSTRCSTFSRLRRARPILTRLTNISS